MDPPHVSSSTASFYNAAINGILRDFYREMRREENKKKKLDRKAALIKTPVEQSNKSS